MGRWHWRRHELESYLVDPVLVGSYFWGGIEAEEQLDAALAVCEKSARS
jgi:hypothetical protein